MPHRSPQSRTLTKRYPMKGTFRTAILLTALLSVLSSCGGRTGISSSPSKGEWTSFRGENTLSGSVDIALPSSPTLLWSTTTGQRTVASPVVKDGVIYTIGRRGLVRGVDSEGTEVFSKDFGTFIEATPLIVDTTMFIGTIDGNLLAMELPSGEVAWHYATEGQISAPPMETDYAGKRAIVFGSYDNYLYTISQRDGETLSRFESGYYLNGATAVMDGYLCFGGCDQWLRVVDTKAGEMTDSLMLDAYIPASPVFSGKDAYVGDYSGNIYHLVIEKGKITSNGKIHTGDPTGESSFTALPAVGKDNVYFFSEGRSITCASRKDGSVKWETLLKGPTGESSPQECRNGVLVCTKSGIISILDKKTGEVKWEYDSGEDILTCPAVVEGRFYVVTAKGTLLCFG